MAASRTFCTAGSKRPIKIAMMAMTTSSSISVNAAERVRKRRMSTPPRRGEKHSIKGCLVRGRLRVGPFPVPLPLIATPPRAALWESRRTQARPAGREPVSRRRPALVVKLLNLLVTEGAGEHHELVHGAVEEPDGAVV